MLTPDEATAALREAGQVRARGRRLAHGQATRLPLVWWGLAWAVTYPAVQFLPFPAALAVSAGSAAAAFALTKVGVRWDPTPGRTGWERQVTRGWWAVLVASFVVDVIAAPAPMQVFFLIPGALWGLALLIYAVVVGDLALGVLGAGIAVLAAVVRLFFLDQSLLLFGLAGGGWMAATGLVRLVGPVGGR
jgi:VIT1/CCC1 family predicted Fe2+/Mn2+ transporter